ncbi:MAG: AgmX/PglI C-terminal domain-containing protein [Rubrivivax sp.]|nr:AgmX/PglI C-terminal domain-containing protein [Rubrivivax sp.]MDP3612115.1 AgmX/PglI C-terminal domain-containing protein [Rubrivivax sp.]
MSALALSPMASFRRPSLPWSNAADDEKRFQRIARTVLMVVLVLGVVMPYVPLPERVRIEAQPLPAPMARLLLERPVTPPAPPPKPQVVDDDKPAVAKPEKAPDKPDPIKSSKPKEAPVPEARNPVANKPPGEVAIDNARRKASGVGLLAMKDQLSEMVAAPAAVQLKQDIKPGLGVGTGTGVGVGAGQEAGIPVRAMITSNATQGSGGINTAAYSKDTGGGGLAGRGTTLVEGVAGGGGGGGLGGGGGRAGGGSGDGSGVGGGKGGTLQRSGSGKSSRSIEDIKLVFERNKGAIYAIYNRALREDPALQGKVVLELKIAPSGEVTGLRIVSSELKAEELEKRLLARIRSFDFGAKDVEVMVVTWPVDFLPS